MSNPLLLEVTMKGFAKFCKLNDIDDITMKYIILYS